MSQSQDCVPAIFNKMASVLADDYDDQFRVVYEQAIQMLEKLPVEPGEEIRNAFDHFSLASSCARGVDAAPFPPPPEFVAMRQDAWTNMEQARRHIVTGRFYCLEHQLICQMAMIDAYVGKLTDEQRGRISPLAETVVALEARLQGATLIDLTPTRVMSEVLEQIAEVEQRIEEITPLLNDYTELYEAIRDTIEAH
jgi:hypothetical protein